MRTHRSAWKRVPSLRARLAALLSLFAPCVALLLASGQASAQPPPVTPPDAPADQPWTTPRIALLTMGPGDDFVTMFGHDALVVEYPDHAARVYNFGMYTQESITVSRVLSGHLRYWLAVAPYPQTVAAYRLQNRSLIAQELALEPTAARALAAALAKNALPENASYRYDYALDNCTTRVRDALDRATGGALRRSLDAAPAPTTYRDHALRLTAGAPLLALLFDLGLGAPADRPLSGWDDAYLPDRLATAVRRVKLSSNGVDRPLVQRETVLFSAKRAPVLERPPSRWGGYLAAGVLVGGALFAGARSGRRDVKRGAAVVALVGSLGVGLLGWLLLGLLLTNVHAVVRPNVNVLMCSPLALAFLPATLKVALGRELATRRAERWALVSAVVAMLGALATLVIGQKTTHLALFFVPYWLGLWALVRGVTPKS